MKTVSCQTEMSGDLTRLEQQLQERLDQMVKLQQTVQDLQKAVEKQSLGCEALTITY